MNLVGVVFTSNISEKTLIMRCKAQELLWEWPTSSCPWCDLSKYQSMSFRILVEDQQVGKVSLCHWTILQSTNVVTFYELSPQGWSKHLLKIAINYLVQSNNLFQIICAILWRYTWHLCEVKIFHTKFQPSSFPNLENKQEHKHVQIASHTTVCLNKEIERFDLVIY